MELITYSEIKERYNVSYKAAYARLARMNITPVKKEKTNENDRVYKRSLFNSEEVEKAFASAASPRKKELWKLSVFDFELEHFIVKRVSLSKGEAEKLLKERRAAGDVARITPHVKKGS